VKDKDDASGYIYDPDLDLQTSTGDDLGDEAESDG